MQNLNLNIIETLDSQKLADTLNKECSKMEERKNLPPLSVLVQVLAQNTEGSKFGVSVEETIPLIQHIKENCQFLKFKGLMSMGQIGNIEEFKSVHELKV